MQHHNGHAFLLACCLYDLLGLVLIVRVFVIGIRMPSTSDTTARQKEVQKQFKIVGLIMLAALPVLFGIYYVTQR